MPLGWTWLHMLGSGQTLSLRTACVFLSFLLTVYYCIYLAASGLVVVHRTLVVSGGSFSAGHGLCSWVRRATERGLGNSACRLSCYMACGVLVPWPGLEPYALLDSQPLGHQGSHDVGPSACGWLFEIKGSYPSTAPLLTPQVTLAKLDLSGRGSFRWAGLPRSGDTRKDDDGRFCVRTCSGRNKKRCSKEICFS